MFSGRDVNYSEYFTLLPFPPMFFENPPPFGAGAMLVLKKFTNNSSALLPQHMEGINLAAVHGRDNVRSCEVYGITDRAGSESLNLDLSRKRAEVTLTAMTSALGFGAAGHIVFSNGLGERFMAEYYGKDKEIDKNCRDENFRGVACYLWESFATATDPFLKVNVAFAAPPAGGHGVRRSFLAALYMGRHRAQPRSPFA